jgi:AcrR family transcriptional regulator
VTIEAGVRKPGRPRDDSIDAAVIKALFDLIEEVGLAATTIDAVAERAAVSKAAIYRRWDSKEQLIVAAVAGLVASVDMQVTGDLRHDLVGTLHAMLGLMTTAPAGAIFPWVMGEVAAGSELGRSYAEAVIVPRRQAIGAALAAAQRSGELRPDLDVDLAVDMLTGPVIMLKLMGDYHRHDPGWGERLVDTLLEGWR